MSYLVTTRNRRLGASIPSDYAGWEVPGTGQTVDDLRKRGYSDAEIQALFSQANRLTKGSSATSNVMDWFGEESIPGVKNGYIAAGAGFLLALAFVSRGRRR